MFVEEIENPREITKAEKKSLAKMTIISTVMLVSVILIGLYFPV